MNKLILTFVAAMTVCFAACAQKKEKQTENSSKTLIVYFSATGTTAKAARTIAEATGGKLCEIVPQQAYTSADLDWRDKQSRSSLEMTDSLSRPALKELDVDMAAYHIVFVGYPIWWNQAPRVINSFIEGHNLQGKTLIPFATSGGSGIVNSVNMLRKSYPDLKWEEGKLLNGAGYDAIQSWANSFVSAE